MHTIEPLLKQYRQVEMIDITVASDKPVIVTGAMRSSNELGADGPVNLVQSAWVAANANSRGRGTLVVFNDEIHSARFVTKTHTMNLLKLHL